MLDRRMGSGKSVLDTFLTGIGLAVAPEWIMGYHLNLGEAARRDVEQNGAVASVFKNQGLPQDAVTNKLHYMCNRRDERIDFDGPLAATRTIADIIGFASDG